MKQITRKYIEKNASLTKRADKRELIYLIGKLQCGFENIEKNKNRIFFEIDIVYEGEEYKWMH